MQHPVSIDELVSAVRPSVVRLSSGRGAGSGTILGRRGFLVTNAHVASEGPIAVVAGDGVRAEASIVAANPDLDLALFRAPDLDVDPLPLGPHDSGRPGQIVVALGYPGGEAISVRAGIIAAHQVASHQDSARGGGRTLLFSDLRLAPGFSGGPMVDAEGRVVAISTQIVGGIAAGVPVESLRRFLREAALEVFDGTAKADRDPCARRRAG